MRVACYASQKEKAVKAKDIVVGDKYVAKVSGNRPRGEEWTCPYCQTQFTGKERK